MPQVVKSLFPIPPGISAKICHMVRTEANPLTRAKSAPEKGPDFRPFDLYGFSLTSGLKDVLQAQSSPAQKRLPPQGDESLSFIPLFRRRSLPHNLIDDDSFLSVCFPIW